MLYGIQAFDQWQHGTPITDLADRDGRLIRRGKQPGFDPGALVDAVRVYDSDAIRSAMRYILGELERCSCSGARDRGAGVANPAIDATSTLLRRGVAQSSTGVAVSPLMHWRSWCHAIDGQRRSAYCWCYWLLSPVRETVAILGPFTLVRPVVIVGAALVGLGRGASWPAVARTIGACGAVVCGEAWLERRYRGRALDDA